MAGPRRPRPDPPGGDRHPVRGLGARRPGGAGRRGLRLLGRHRLPDAFAGFLRGLGAVRAGDRRGRAVQVRDHPARRLPHPARGPAGPPHRGPAGHRVGGARLAPRVGGRRVAGPPGGRTGARGAVLRVRGASAVLAARPVLPGTRGPTARVRQGDGFHPCGADAGRGAPVRRLVGLPGHRLLRADGPPGHPGRLQVPGGPAAPGRHRGADGLGAGPLPARRVGAGRVRRAPAVRAPRSAAGRASRLGHAGVRPGPARGAQLPGGERRLLVRGVPCGRPAGGRGGLHALPGLLARAGPVDAERARRPGEPGRGGLPPGDERHRVPALPRGGDRRRGVHRLGRGDPADRQRRAGLRPEVEHGLDARLTPVHVARPRAPRVPPPRDDLLDDVRVQRELRPADLPRRGGARQAVAGLQDAGRLVAATRGPARLPGLHVGPPGQATPLHGAGVRAGRRVVRSARPGLVAPRPVVPRRARSPGRPRPRARSQRPLPGHRRAVAAGHRPVRLPVDHRRRGRRQRPRLPPALRRRRPGPRRLPLLPGAPPRLRDRRPGRRPGLGGDAEHGRRALRRQRGDQPGAAEGGAAGRPRPPGLRPPDPAPLGHGVAAAGLTTGCPGAHRSGALGLGRRARYAGCPARAAGRSPVCSTPSRWVARVRAT
ncbi:hypothetical protein SGPA1_11675 [Streptomyces misionensis JCM 4497]